MIGGDAGGGISTRVFAPEARGVAVDGFAESFGRGDLGHDLGVLLENPGPVHHLREVAKSVVREQSLDRRGIEPFARGLEVGRRDAARDAEVDRHASRSRLGQHELEARLAENVGDLVRIADRRDGAVADRDPGEFRRREHAALDVDVGVDEAGQENPGRRARRLEGRIDVIGPCSTSTSPGRSPGMKIDDLVAQGRHA